MINQWANIVSVGNAHQAFFAHSGFLLQEGHTVHETEAEAREETFKMLEVYAQFAREYLALAGLDRSQNRK
jgi:prolyl-tRNA synthetase